MPGTVLGSLLFLADLLQRQISGVGFSIGLFGDPMQLPCLVFSEQEIIGSDPVHMESAPSAQTLEDGSLGPVKRGAEKTGVVTHSLKKPEYLFEVESF